MANIILIRNSNGVTRVIVSSNKPTFNPLFSRLIEGEITLNGETLTIEGMEREFELYFNILGNKTYISKEEIKLYCEKDIRYTKIFKKPYLKGWVERKERKSFKIVTNSFEIIYED